MTYDDSSCARKPNVVLTMVSVELNIDIVYFKSLLLCIDTKFE